MNKNTKVYFGDKQLKVVRNRKGQFKKAGKDLLGASGVVLLLTIIFSIGYVMNKNEVVKTIEIPVIVEVATKANILERIIQCESGGKHYDTNGQVLVRGNEGSRKSVDIGIAQINSMYWGKKATELGLNLMVEEDNRKMAEYIFSNYGSEPWSSSKRCWSK